MFTKISCILPKIWLKCTGIIGIVDYLRNAEVREALISYDDKILSGDARQREPNKPNRSAPRSVRQKSYR